MRKPKCSDFRESDGSCDYEGYEDKMGDYEDSMREKELEKKYEKEDENE